MRRFGGALATLAAAFAAALAALAGVVAAPQDARAAVDTPRTLGAFIGKQTLADDSTAPFDPAEIDAFADRVGARPGVVMWYQNWERDDRNGFNPASESGAGVMDEVAARGAMPMVTWTPRDPDLPDMDQPEYALSTIINGQHDAYIEQWARDAAAWGKPFYLRFAHEMNGKWQPWSPGVNGNKTSEYVAAWRHVHDIFEREGATNVRWVWSPYVSCKGCTAFGKVYPGDAYVDWVALDGYNYGVSGEQGSWQTMERLFGKSYGAVTKLAPSKPFMISEIASAEAGGDKAAWISDAFLKTIPERMPKTRAVIWFDSVKERDWRVNSSDASLAAYQTVAANPAYAGRLP